MTAKTQKKEEALKKMMFSYTASDDTEQLESENKVLQETVNQLQSELLRYQQPALMICEIAEVIDGNKHAIIKVPNGNQFYVNVSQTSDTLFSGDHVLCEQKNLTVIKKVTAVKKYDIDKFVIIDKPKISWKEIGGLSEKINEIQEVIELPLQKPELFKKVGIEPPKGILLYGPPGTGKTMLAKAVASSTNSTFIEIVGSELVQKFIGEGAKLVKEVFQLARERAPAIIFIDEIDALCAKRIEVGTSGEREVQRTFMQFLAELDGFKRLDNVKIIGTTNRKDILDPAITRPGRLDRLIHVPAPSGDGIKEVFKIHTKNMTLSKKIKLKEIYKLIEGFTGAEIKSVCTEAGYFAIRADKIMIDHADLVAAIEKVQNDEEFKENHENFNMFG
ncbi:MAG: proteasome regulatory subunit [Candidatus Woesearchaeota archaeon]|jgi:proteasome regulatory subunit